MSAPRVGITLRNCRVPVLVVLCEIAAVAQSSRSAEDIPRIVRETSPSVVTVVLRDRQLKDGQNLNFAIPAAYVGPLPSDGPVKLLSEISSTAQENKPSAVDIGLVGSYTGVWQSGRFSVSGAAAMTVRVDGNAVAAEIFLTGNGSITNGERPSSGSRKASKP